MTNSAALGGALENLLPMWTSVSSLMPVFDIFNGSLPVGNHIKKMDKIWPDLKFQMEKYLRRIQTRENRANLCSGSEFPAEPWRRLLRKSSRTCFWHRWPRLWWRRLLRSVSRCTCPCRSWSVWFCGTWAAAWTWARRFRCVRCVDTTPSRPPHPMTSTRNITRLRIDGEMK